MLGRTSVNSSPTKQRSSRADTWLSSDDDISDDDADAEADFRTALRRAAEAAAAKARSASTASPKKRKPRRSSMTEVEKALHVVPTSDTLGTKRETVDVGGISASKFNSSAAGRVSVFKNWGQKSDSMRIDDDATTDADTDTDTHTEKEEEKEKEKEKEMEKEKEKEKILGGKSRLAEQAVTTNFKPRFRRSSSSEPHPPREASLSKRRESQASLEVAEAAAAAAVRDSQMTFEDTLMVRVPHLSEDDFTVPIVAQHARFGESSLVEMIKYWKQLTDSSFHHAKTHVQNGAIVPMSTLCTTREASISMREHSEATARLHFQYAKRVKRFVCQMAEELLDEMQAQRKNLETKFKNEQNELKAKRKALKAKKVMVKIAEKELKAAKHAVALHAKGLSKQMSKADTIGRGLDEQLRGFLFKKGGGSTFGPLGRRNWKERLFLLCKPRQGVALLHYYASPTDLKPKGTVAIDADTVCKTVVLEGKNFAFQIFHNGAGVSKSRKGKLHYEMSIQAPCEDDRQVWVSCINETAKQLNAERELGMGDSASHSSSDRSNGTTHSPALGALAVLAEDTNDGNNGSDNDQDHNQDSNVAESAAAAAEEEEEEGLNASETKTTSGPPPKRKHRRLESSMKDHKLVGLESRLSACKEQAMLTKVAVQVAENSMEKVLEHYCCQIRAILSTYQSLEHTRINITKTLVMDAIDAEEELHTRKLELVKKLREDVEKIDPRKDVDYFIKSNQSPSDPWSKMSGNIGRVISSDLVPDPADNVNPMHSGFLIESTRVRLRGSISKRPDSMQVNRHASERLQSEDQLALSWQQFQAQYADTGVVDHPDIAPAPISAPIVSSPLVPAPVKHPHPPDEGDK